MSPFFSLMGMFTAQQLIIARLNIATAKEQAAEVLSQKYNITRVVKILE